MKKFSNLDLFQPKNREIIFVDYLEKNTCRRKLAAECRIRPRKTTLLRLLNLLESPTSGKILFEGNPISQREDPDSMRRRMKMIFQSQVVFKDSVFNNIALGLRYRGYSKEEIKRRVVEKLYEMGHAGYKN